MELGHLLTLSVSHIQKSPLHWSPLNPSAFRSVMLTIINTYYIETVILHAISIRVT
jgi:hypothetical protein